MMARRPSFVAVVLHFEFHHAFAAACQHDKLLAPGMFSSVQHPLLNMTYRNWFQPIQEKNNGKM